jgi:hypothetical protein
LVGNPKVPVRIGSVVYCEGSTLRVINPSSIQVFFFFFSF